MIAVVSSGFGMYECHSWLVKRSGVAIGGQAVSPSFHPGPSQCGHTIVLKTVQILVGANVIQLVVSCCGSDGSIAGRVVWDSIENSFSLAFYELITSAHL